MALTAISLLCFTALLCFPALGLPADSGKLEEIPVKVTIVNDFTNEQLSYSTTVIQEGLMFGVLNQLMESNADFKFSYTIHHTFGIYLESVNGLAGSDEDQTYWELLSEKSGVVTRLEVGIGCYQVQRDENLILRFTTWATKK
ncbi:transcobalamin beta a precursor [Danio rerio]|uniref:Similar to Transcobalamin-1 (Transcobalamin I) (TCI) (TC I) n=1 Tax=Danio rerio TaxID=7955 RepID=A2BFT0_DANRE|nr:transcobalamin beta a precursor [Danio rerio]AAI62189.1 Similar to Transcobalamin-1 precursor (Transcobalamin I) (TCI) (TC I) [Danio rerio]AAI62201.1 Similar to Transcobalamin-1 precursor (Transcobalamin I) (TCI) (TC I) [Danio rerio]|eukprot:NP_001122207.1 transcobalamin beta a precursor [Danio rerio]